MKQWIKLLTLFLMVFVAGKASAQNVAAIGTQEYATLQAAFDAATDGQTVKLLGDYNAVGVSNAGGTRQFVINKSITFDGGGFTLTTQDRGIGIGNVNNDVTSNIDVTIKNITIKNASSGARCIDTRGRIGSLTLENATLKTDGATSGYTQPLTIGGNQADAATINISNSTIQTNNAGTAYYAIITFNPVKMNITGSTIKGWACIYAKGPDGSAGSAGSVINIDGGTLVSSNAYSGVSNTFGAFMIEDNNVNINVTNSNITINNTGNQDQAVVCYKSNNYSGIVTLGEGNNITFAGPNDCRLRLNGSQNNLNVTGGTFNFDPTEYLSEGYTAVENNGVWTVQEVEYVAKIGDVKYETLAEAVAATQAGDVIEVIKAGDYTLPNLPKNVTVEGAVEGVVFTHTTAGNVASIPNGATFKNVKFVFGNVDYHGFQHAGTINMEGCTLDGRFCSYGDMNFTGCNFTQSSSDYHMWCYSGNVTYTDCTFTNSATGKFLNVYNESGATKYTVTVTNCKFVNTTSANKAALNVKATSGANVLAYDVIINNCTTEGAFPEVLTSDALYVLNSLVQVDDRTASGVDNIKVWLDDVLIYPKSVAEIVGGDRYPTLQAAVDAAQQLGGAQTIKLLDDISGETVTIQEVANFKLTIDGKKDDSSNYTVDAVIVVDGLRGNGGSTTNGASVTIQNIAFVKTTSTDGIQASHYPHDLTIQDCTYTGFDNEKWFLNASVDGPLYGVTVKNVTVENARLIYANMANDAVFQNITATNNCTVGFNVKTSGTALIENCQVTTGKYAFRDYSDAYEGIFTLKDNTFISTSTASDEGVIVNRGGAVGTAHINVESGTYTGPIKVLNNKEGVLAISGGYFSEEFPQEYIAADLVAQGKVCAPATDKEGYFTIGDPHYVAQIGETKYVSLQAALDAAYAMTGDVTIELIDNIEGYSIVKQKAGLNLTIDGKEKTVAGQIIIDGDGGSTRTETLDIKNIKFEDNKTNFVSGSDAFILVPSTNTAGTPYYNKPTNNYAHNVTISDCSFTSTSSGLDVVGVKSNSKAAIYNVVINNNTGTNLHSLVQLTAPTNGTITNNTVSGSESFLNVSGGTGDFTVSGNTFTSAEGANGYGVRENGTSTAVITLTDNNFTAANAVKLGKDGSATNGTINVVSGTYVGDIVKDIAATATGKIVISGGHFSASLADQQYAEFIAEGMAGVNGLYPEEELAKNGVGTAVASVTDSEGKVLNYASLEAAMAAAPDGATVKLLADCSGGGIVVPQGTYTTGLTVDFDNHTYTVVGPGLAGSTGTQNQCFQLLKDNNITFQNGAIVADNSNLKMIIQNYANLTLDNMTLDATQGTNSMEYVLSTNNGSTTINDTNITAKDGSVAFDACCGWGGYNSNNVELTGSSVVTGPIEVSFYGEGTAPTLTLTSGTHNGEIVMGKNADQATITKTDTFVQNAPEGYKWVSNGEGTGTSTLTPKVYVAQIGEGDSAVKYETLAEAVEAASDGDTITMIADDPSLSNGSEVEINKSLTITGPTAENGEPLYTISGNSDVTGSNDIFITGSGNVTISNLKIKNFGNNAKTDAGHAPLYVSTHFTGNLKLSNVYISDFNRGGLFLYGGNFEVDNCYIDCANATSGAFTKGIEIKGNATGTIKNTLICNMERSSTAYSNAGIEIYGNGSVTVEDCTILSDKDGHAAVKGTYGIVSSRVGEHNPSGGTLEVKGCQIDTSNGSISISDDDTYGPVNNYSITVDDCDFTNYISTWSATSSITINSGSFSEDVYADAGTINIKGGVFTNFAPTTGDNGTIAISGGIFDEEVAEEYCAEGFIPTANTDPDTMEDYPYTVKSGKFVAQIGDVKYETLAEAVAAVPENGTSATTIKLLENVTESASISNGKNIVLDLNEKTMTGGITMNGGSLNAQNGTIAGTVNLYGSADESATNYNNFTLDATATINASWGFILREASGTKVAYGCNININGTMNGTAWVMGNIEKGNSVINVNNGAKIEGLVFGLNGFATLNVKEGATIIGSETGIEVRAGVLNVEDGATITSTASAYTYEPNGSGTTTTGAAIAVAQHNTLLSTEVNILGGTLSGVHNIAVIDAQSNDLDKVTVKVKDELIGESTLIPEGYAWSSNGDGTSSPKKAVAKIGDTLYASLKDAVAAVPANGTETTITMIDNETIDVVGYAITIASNQNVVIDLAGHTVAGQCTTGKTSALIRNLGTLKIQDSTGSGKLTMSAEPYWVYSEADPGGYASNLIRNEKDLTVESGLLYNFAEGSACYAIDNYSAGNVTINGGKVDAAKASAIRMFYVNGGSITVNDGVIGHFNSEEDCSYMGIQVMSGANVNVTVKGGTIVGEYAFYANNTGGKIDISGGTFDGYVAFGSAGPNDISITGGAFNYWVGTWGTQTKFISGGIYADSDFDKALLADDYVFAANTDEATNDVYPYMVRLGVFVAEIVGGAKYESLQDAVNAVKTDGTETTIKMLADVNEYVEIDGGRNIILDVNEKNPAGYLDLYEGNLTITGGTYAGAVYVNGSAENTDNYNHFTLDASATVGDGDFSIIPWPASGTNNAYGSTIDIFGTTNGAVFVSGNITTGNSVINVEDGATIKGDVGIALNGYATLNVNGGSITGSEVGIEARAGHLVVTGGTITSTATDYTYAANGNGTTSTGPAIAVAQHTTLLNTIVDILGGTLVAQGDNPLIAVVDAQNNNLDKVTVTVLDEFKENSDIPEAFMWVAGETEGTSTLAPRPYVAQIGDVKYWSLADAIAAVPTDGTETTILLLENITEGAVINSGKNIVLDLNEKTLTGGIDQYDSNLTLTNGALNGTVYVNGGPASAEAGYNHFTLANDATINAGFGIILWQGPTGNDAYGSVIDINGTVNGTTWVMGNITQGNSVINVNSGAKIEGDVFGLNGLATLNVKNGATIIGAETGIEVRAGVLNVEDGAIIKSTAAEYTYEPNGSGTTTTGAAIAVAQHNTQLPIEVNINGATLTGVHNIAVIDAQSNSLDEVTVTVKDNLIIASTLIPDGFVWTSNNDGTSTLKPAVAKIGDTYYATIEDAFAAVTEGSELILLHDVEMTKDYTAAKSFTLTTDGHSLDSQGHHIILNNGVTVTTDAQQPGLYEPIDSSKYAVKEEANGDEYTYTCMTIEDFTGEYILYDIAGEKHPYPTEYEGKHAKKVTYKRTIASQVKNRYQCWYIPIDYTITESDVADMDFFRIHLIAPSSSAGEMTDNEIWMYIEKMKAGETLRGNRPYVIRSKGSKTKFEYVANNVDLLPRKNDIRLEMSTAKTQFDYYGTYGNTKTKAHSLTLYSEDNLYWANNTELLPYRWYIHVTSKQETIDYANMTFFIVEEGETTGIDNLDITEDNEIEGIYTIDGKKLDHPMKGLNIIKMKDNTVKKVYIK